MEAYILDLKNEQEWRMADHNGSTDVSTTPLLGVLDTNHHVSMYVHVYPDACLGQERNPSWEGGAGWWVGTGNVSAGWTLGPGAAGRRSAPPARPRSTGSGRRGRSCAGTPATAPWSEKRRTVQVRGGPAPYITKVFSCSRTHSCKQRFGGYMPHFLVLLFL